MHHQHSGMESSASLSAFRPGAPGVQQLPVSSRLERHAGSQHLLFRRIKAYLNSLPANSCVTLFLVLGPGEGTRRSYQPRDRLNARFSKTSLWLPRSGSPGEARSAGGGWRLLWNLALSLSKLFLSVFLLSLL